MIGYCLVRMTITGWRDYRRHLAGSGMTAHKVSALTCCQERSAESTNQW